MSRENSRRPPDVKWQTGLQFLSVKNALLNLSRQRSSAMGLSQLKFEVAMQMHSIKAKTSTTQSLVLITRLGVVSLHSWTPLVTFTWLRNSLVYVANLFHNHWLNICTSGAKTRAQNLQKRERGLVFIFVIWQKLMARGGRSTLHILKSMSLCSFEYI